MNRKKRENEKKRTEKRTTKKAGSKAKYSTTKWNKEKLKGCKRTEPKQKTQTRNPKKIKQKINFFFESL